MAIVLILPESIEGTQVFRAMAGGKQSLGKTAGEAWDALSAQLSEDEAETLIVVQKFRPDRFFGASQQQRLAELMTQWRSARDRGDDLTDEEQAELQTLVDSELSAAAARSHTLADALRR